MPRVIPLHFSEGHWVEAEGSFWRVSVTSVPPSALRWLAVSSRPTKWATGLAGVSSVDQADLPSHQLRDTLEGFHITSAYLRDYDAVSESSSTTPSRVEAHCHRFIAERAPWASVLEDAKHAGDLKLRPIHGDPKVNNLMMDAETGKAIALVDLDTVKPGLVHYDIGDCLRQAGKSIG